MKLISVSSLIITCSLLLCACDLKIVKTGLEDKARGPETVRAVGLRNSLDPLTVAIDAERWTVMIDNANAAMKLKHPELVEDDLLRIDLALRSGVRDMLALRDSLCLANEKPMETCIPLEVPDWVSNPPNNVTSLQEYEARSQWLGEEVGSLTQIGCEAGHEVSNDPFLCAVE